MKQLLDAFAVDQTIKRIASQLAALEKDIPLALVGIHAGGGPLTQRLAAALKDKGIINPKLGSIDITLYRDDGFGPNDWPQVGVTKIPFDLKTHTVVLVDDVLFTGRTVRAAMDVILDYGRPHAIRLVVLVDRGLRELPIQADISGHTIQTTHTEHIQVVLSPEYEESDAVLITDRT